MATARALTLEPPALLVDEPISALEPETVNEISQVSGTYGKDTADTIVENCTNTLILRCSASEQGGTSQFASRLIGQREVVYQTHSKTSQPGQWMSSRTGSEHRTVEHAIMASEIERLPDLQGYLKLASYPDW